MREFTEPAMRPPQEARSLLLQATQGCTWNKCKFCYVSRGYLFLAVKPQELIQQIERRKKFVSPQADVYFTGSNPFALPARKLKEYLQVLHKHFPGFGRASMQARIDDIEAKSDSEIAELRDLGLKHIYIGAENGSEEVLALMDKGHTAARTIEQLNRLAKLGLTFTNFYILGMGGKGRGKSSGEATAKMFNAAKPYRITTTGLTIFPETPLATMAAAGEFIEASEREKIEELYASLTTLQGDMYYDGVHHLNPLNYRFKNNDKVAKDAVLKDIEEVLATHTDADLEAMVNRKAMLSL